MPTRAHIPKHVDTPPPVIEIEYRSGLTVHQFGQRVGVSDWTVYRMIRDNEVRSFKLGRSRRIPDTEVSRVIARALAESEG